MTGLGIRLRALEQQASELETRGEHEEALWAWSTYENLVAEAEEMCWGCPDLVEPFDGKCPWSDDEEHLGHARQV